MKFSTYVTQKKKKKGVGLRQQLSCTWLGFLFPWERARRGESLSSRDNYRLGVIGRSRVFTPFWPILSLDSV